MRLVRAQEGDSAGRVCGRCVPCIRDKTIEPLLSIPWMNFGSDDLRLYWSMRVCMTRVALTEVDKMVYIPMSMGPDSGKKYELPPTDI